MSALNLILGQKQVRTQIGVLTLDAAEEVSHEMTATPTKNPIEDGSVVTDNIKLEPRQLSISGIVSEAPLSLLGSAFNIFTGSVATQVGKSVGGFGSVAAAAGIGSIAGLIANRNSEDVNFPVKSYEFMRELWKARVPFDIVTRLEKYSNMVVTKLSVPQRKEDGRSFVFSATFEQIQLVKTQTTIITEATSAGPQTQNLGKQPVKDATAENVRGSTTLFDGWKALSGG